MTKVSDYDQALEFEGVLEMEDDWVIVSVPQAVHDKLIQQVSAPIKPNKKPHISVIKDESPCFNQADWDSKKFSGEKIKFKVASQYDHENGLHVWFNCYSPRLCEIREHFGLPVLKKDGIYLVNFHTTIGKLVKPVKANLRPQYRLSKRTHIDVETLMQHI